MTDPRTIVKTRKPKSNPKDPKSYPGYDDALHVGQRRWKKMENDIGTGKTFENEAHKRDYMRKVASNPSNVLGLPPTYPALPKLKMMLSDVKAAIPCDACGGCCTHIDRWICPRCGKDNSEVHQMEAAHG